MMRAAPFIVLAAQGVVVALAGCTEIKRSDAVVELVFAVDAATRAGARDVGVRAWTRCDGPAPAWQRFDEAVRVQLGELSGDAVYDLEARLASGLDERAWGIAAGVRAGQGRRGLVLTPTGRWQRLGGDVTPPRARARLYAGPDCVVLLDESQVYQVADGDLKLAEPRPLPQTIAAPIAAAVVLAQCALVVAAGPLGASLHLVEPEEGGGLRERSISGPVETSPEVLRALVARADGVLFAIFETRAQAWRLETRDGRLSVDLLAAVAIDLGGPGADVFAAPLGPDVVIVAGATRDDPAQVVVRALVLRDGALVDLPLDDGAPGTWHHVAGVVALPGVASGSVLIFGTPAETRGAERIDLDGRQERRLDVTRSLAGIDGDCTPVRTPVLLPDGRVLALDVEGGSASKCVYTPPAGERFERPPRCR